MARRPAIRPLLQPKLNADMPAAVIDLDRQIAAAEHLGRDQIRVRQLAQLAGLAQHFAAASPRFAQRLAQAGLAPGELARMDGFTRLPPMDRRALQDMTGLFADRLPAGHEPAGMVWTSGSTGEPITVRRTRVSQMIWMANILREHRWRGSDFSVPLAGIRANVFEPRPLPSWGAPADFVARTGPSVALPIYWDVEKLFDTLAHFRPGNLLVYPTTLAALLELARARGSFLADNPVIRSIGETLTPALRERCQAVLGVRLRDVYSSQEIGYIALECPEGDCYHVAAESLIVEVLRPDGSPCEPGEIGAVVVTDLTNAATPLVRYAIGDHAEVAAPCSCGRGALALRRIVGRERNMILMPDGSRHWPVLGATQFHKLAPIRQYQVVQQAPTLLEARFAVTRPLTESEETTLRKHMQQSLGYPFEIEFRWFEEDLPGSRSGKFEEFLRLF